LLYRQPTAQTASVSFRFWFVEELKGCGGNRGRVGRIADRADAITIDNRPELREVAHDDGNACAKGFEETVRSRVVVAQVIGRQSAKGHVGSTQPRQETDLWYRWVQDQSPAKSRILGEVTEAAFPWPAAKKDEYALGGQMPQRLHALKQASAGGV
jgi:hypothetical protein